MLKANTLKAPKGPSTPSTSAGGKHAKKPPLEKLKTLNPTKETIIANKLSGSFMNEDSIV